MSEFRKAFYIHCPIHEEIEHPKWRKCPKCEGVITYSEEEVLNLLKRHSWEMCDLDWYSIDTDWFENNKK